MSQRGSGVLFTLATERHKRFLSSWESTLEYTNKFGGKASEVDASLKKINRDHSSLEEGLNSIIVQFVRYEGTNCGWSVWSAAHVIALYVCCAVLQHDRKSVYYNFLFIFSISNVKVIRSSIVQKMELIKDLLTTKRRTSELSVNTAELKGDLDLAKTQIGMTESLLKALSPSDTLEIFTKLEVVCPQLSIFYNFVNCFSPGYIFISFSPAPVVSWWSNSGEELHLNTS